MTNNDDDLRLLDALIGLRLETRRKEGLFEEEGEDVKSDEEVIGLTPQRRENKAGRKFRKEREALTRYWFTQFNHNVFANKLPAELPIKWVPRLRKTAGRAFTDYDPLGRVKSVRIELSDKVCDDERRLKNTLLHELCHVAQSLIDGVREAPHGQVFRKWARLATATYPELAVSTTHSYEIHASHIYSCIDCGLKVPRNSKIRGLERFRCGHCNGSLRFDGKYNRDGTPSAVRQPTPFSAFVKDNFASATRDGMKPKEVLAELSKQWKRIRAGSP